MTYLAQSYDDSVQYSYSVHICFPQIIIRTLEIYTKRKLCVFSIDFKRVSHSIDVRNFINFLRVRPFYYIIILRVCSIVEDST